MTEQPEWKLNVDHEIEVLIRLAKQQADYLWRKWNTDASEWETLDPIYNAAENLDFLLKRISFCFYANRWSIAERGSTETSDLQEGPVT